MKFSAIVRTLGDSTIPSCSGSGRLIIQSAKAQKSQTLVIAADTDYDQKKGNKEAGYSFRGQDPVPAVSKIASQAVFQEYETLLARHLKDYQALEGAFGLELPDPKHSAEVETAAIFSSYNWTSSGDPFLESLLFDYSRHLLISSSRDNSLPANLQGRWTERLDSAWGADYHANINLQMNYWAAEQTGLSDTEGALWNYMRDTWVPRGTETARLLYNADGWVVHNEMNIFGHTAMKESALWADCKVHQTRMESSIPPANRQRRPGSCCMDDATCMGSLRLHPRRRLATEARLPAPEERSPVLGIAAPRRQVLRRRNPRSESLQQSRNRPNDVRLRALPATYPPGVRQRANQRRHRRGRGHGIPRKRGFQRRET